MIRGTVQSALCLFLSPLLVAQQTSQTDHPPSGVAPAETVFAYRTSMLPDESGNTADESGSLYGLSIVPFEVPVELTPINPAAWANASKGSTLTFRVVRDVIVSGGVFNRKSFYADVNAGTLIEGKVIRLRRGKLRTRNGRTEPRVKEILVGKRIKLEVESAPVDRRFSAFARNLIIWPVKSVIAVGEYTYLVILCTIAGGCEI